MIYRYVLFIESKDAPDGNQLFHDVPGLVEYDYEGEVDV